MLCGAEIQDWCWCYVDHVDLGAVDLASVVMCVHFAFPFWLCCLM